jgi:hypothetical protein
MWIVANVDLSLWLTNEHLRYEDVWGTGRVDPRILVLGTSGRWVVSFTPQTLYPLSGLDPVEKTTVLAPLGIEPRKSCPILYRVSYPSKNICESMKTKLKLNSVAWVRERTIQTEQSPLVGELSATFCGCHVVSVTDPYGRILGFLDRSRYFFFQ